MGVITVFGSSLSARPDDAVPETYSNSNLGSLRPSYCQAQDKSRVVVPIACIGLALLAVVFSNGWAENKPEPQSSLTLDLGGVVKMEFVRIKAGSFRMGSPDSDKDAYPDEKPQHKVTLTKDFYLGKYPVTQEQYEKVLGKNPSEFSAKGNMRHRVVGLDTTRFPVDSVLWDDASAFCKVMEGLTHCKCALPSESQWEYACRAGSETRYFFGSDENRLGDYVWHPPETSDCPGRTYEVGRKKPNAWGLFDMVGNVEQWCRDKYDERYYAEGDKTDPEGPDNGPRVLRGGSWLFDARSSRCAYRDCDGIRGWNYAIGFRVLVRVD